MVTATKTTVVSTKKRRVSKRANRSKERLNALDRSTFFGTVFVSSEKKAISHGAP
jgi:hypothetical protein